MISRRVIRQALVDALPATWNRRAQTFEAARPHPGDLPQLLPARRAVAPHRGASRGRRRSVTAGGTTTVELLELLHPEALRDALVADARAGLLATPKTLPPKYFYDARGSELFEEITRLPEYYPTRAERGLLRENATAIIDAAGADTLVELGSGSSEKTGLLLDALAARGAAGAYVPVDVSPAALRGAVTDLAASRPVPTRRLALPMQAPHLSAWLGSRLLYSSAPVLRRSSGKAAGRVMSSSAPSVFAPAAAHHRRRADRCDRAAGRSAYFSPAGGPNCSGCSRPDSPSTTTG